MTRGHHGTDHSWLSALAESMREEHDYTPALEGVLPATLHGSLFRNGPGRFEFGGVQKTHLLDGDGMIQAFDFVNGSVRYRNRFVRTEKYLAEERAGRFTLPSWTTRAPGGVLRNFGDRIKSQAGVTAVVKNDLLYAFDEVGLPYVLDPDTLETQGEKQVGAPHARVHYKAHTKTDERTGHWVLVGVEQGPTMFLHVAEHAADGSLRSAQRIAAPRAAYFHDWFATARYVVVSLQPVKPNLFRFLGGFASFSDSMQWRADLGNLVMVIDRSGAQNPVILEAPPCFMWHALNAYDEGDSIVADFVGYDAPDHFLGEKAAFRTIMQGQSGEQRQVGMLRRYVIHLPTKQIRQEIISTESHEFPVVGGGKSLYRHRYGYCTIAARPTVFHNGLARVDVDTGARDIYYMGDKVHLGEPVFAHDASASDPEQGWLMSLGLNGATGRSFLAIFRASALSDGPVTVAHLTHPTPLSFHGWWNSR